MLTSIIRIAKNERRQEKILNNFLSDTVRIFDDPTVSEEKIVELIIQLANSGEKLNFNSRVFDFASTGGPSSLSTILVPLYLYAHGENVINLAIPGRPAGAVDVLSQIPYYQLNNIQTSKLEKKHFYLHLEADEKFVPLDKKLFDYRKKVNKIDVPNLAIASLLAKKLASGASNIGLDVRVSSFGNFGKNWEECVQNAKKYNRIANALGIESTCFLSDANAPYQPYIGRGEALVALHNIINNACGNRLNKHNYLCVEIVKSLLHVDFAFSSEVLKRAFLENLILQNSDYHYFESKVEEILAQPYRLLCAPVDGFVYYNLLEIRNYLVCRQSLDERITKYPDPSGMTLLQEQGSYIEKGQPVLRIRNPLPCLEDKYSFFNIERNESIPEHESEVI